VTQHPLLPSPPAPSVPPGHGLDGVIIGVCPADLYLAKACCASVRRFLGEIPITLLTDGPVATSSLESVYGTGRLAMKDIGSELIPLEPGTCLPKLSIFWASPYERFLYLDADTIVWGDLRVHAALDKFAFIAAHGVPKPGVVESEHAASAAFFDVPALRRFDTDLQFLHRPSLVAGVFMARRGVFSQQRVVDLVRRQCFKASDQGVMNYLFWRSLQDGTPAVGAALFQVVPKDGLMLDPALALPIGWTQPVVFHWMGKKPKLGRPAPLVDEFRREFLRRSGRRHGLRFSLRAEEVSVVLHQHWNSLRKRFRRVRC
jgi:hypothetical protein